MTEFVHLHVHSDYSLADASVSVMALADKAEALGMTHLALTDHGNMFGAMDFIFACKETVVLNNEGKEEHEKRKNPIIPIIGCEVYVSPGSRFEKKGSENENKYYHLILLAANREGYFNLVKLCSYAYTEGFYYRPRIDEELLKQYHGGLIALSACASGEIPRLIQAGKTLEAEEKAIYYRDLFGKDDQGNPNFYLEIMEHGIPAGTLKGADMSQKDINDAVAGISLKTGIPLVATNDVHYLEREDYIAHDILLCIGTGKIRTEEKRKKYYGDQFYFKTGDEMAALFADYPEAITNTVRIAQRCNADIPKIKNEDLPKYLPDFSIPDGFENAGDYLRHLTMQGIVNRYAQEFAANGNEKENILKRADYELDTIINMGYTGYFLIVWDFIRYAREHDIPVGPGRGSGAGSIVAYALRITDIDPLKYGLLFERFLNPDRISMPDFDIDFANEGRDEVIKYVTEKYGEEKVSQIITFGTLGAKAVIKDVARVLDIKIPESEMITKLIPRDPDIKLKKAIKDEPKLQEHERDPRFTELFALAYKLEGLNRHSSIHAAGIVIGKTPLLDFVPLYQERRDSKSGKSGSIATQYSMNFLEQCGLVKMDFLGLKTLDIIKHTQNLIRNRGGKYSDFNIENAPEGDKAAFKMLGKGNSFGIFQFESEGMQNILKQTKPSSIGDLTALNAMYRPGPMQNIPRFVESKNGRQEITYPDKSLEGILKETYGVIVYQEQVMEVARIIAGYGMGQADLLRRAMGKKNEEILKKEKIPFIEGALKQGYTREKAEYIYDMLVPFAGYGFNKSHAAAYAVLAYHTAYLKANFPVEFMAANLSNDIHSADKNRISYCIEEARKMGIEVVPPNVNHSNRNFSVADGRIVYGFLGIKGFGEAPADEIVRCRKDGPYTSFMDFLERVNIKTVGKKGMELLAQTGAFDSFGITRETLFGNLEKVMEYALKKKEDKMTGQTSLFEDSGEQEFSDFVFEKIDPMSRSDILNLEKKLIGFYISGHPMDEYKEIWEKTNKFNLGQTDTYKTGSCILTGIITSIKNYISPKGSRMVFASLEDYNGEIDVTFFAEAWLQCERFVDVDKVVILQGKIDYQKDKDKFTFIAETCLNNTDMNTALKDYEEQATKEEAHRNTWLYMADLKSSFIDKAQKGNYTIIGYLKRLKETQDRNGNDMAFGTLQDFEGEIDLLFFSKTYESCRNLLKLDEIIAFKGSVDPEADRERGNKQTGFRVTSIADFALLSRSALRKITAGEKPPVVVIEDEPVIVKTNEIHIRLKKGAADSDKELLPLRDYLAENAGSCLLFIHIPIPDGEKTMRAYLGIENREDDKTINDLKQINCVAEVWRK
ncbi:MAG: DNA polymerase III subunit alpha [Treponema sp.]|jgi:DNA polymerase-3 subunit alpha|nr:DNA polymerase III subunit alpha [Treponema sp.]